MICIENYNFNFISDIGFFCLLVSYFINDPYYLRLCLSISCLIILIWGFLALPQRACYSTVIWNLLFLIINLFYTRKEYINKYKIENTSIQPN